MNDIRHIKIFDTTLRDGQQCPGAAMSFENNLKYARLAAAAGVDVLEAGYPAASKADYEIVNAIATELGDKPDSPVIAALCQLREEQIDITIQALFSAMKYNKARLHVYLPVDPALMPASLGKDAEDKRALVRRLHDCCKKAVDAGLEVEFSPEGYSRMRDNFDFVTDLIRAALQAGAGVINCPDTIGAAYRREGAEYFVEKMKLHAEIVRREFPDKTVIWSTHCHNDFGMAVENSITAVFDGPARQIEGCINGIGERAGNAALEQCIMIIKHFSKYIDAERPFYTTVKTELIQRLSDFVRDFMLPRQPHWPISGDNAARHSAGGHTNAVLKNPLAYQPFDPKETGQKISLLFGPLSGSNHAKAVIRKHGYACEENEKVTIAQFIKDLYKERRKGITDEELMEGYFEYRRPIRIEDFDYSRTKNHASILVKGAFFGKTGEIEASYEGKDSALATLKQLIDQDYPGLEIESYNSESVGTGIHAASLSTIVVSTQEKRLFSGKGTDQDIEKSAMKALVSAVNKAYVDSLYKLK
jgi:2-isopropylmalate synthase